MHNVSSSFLSLMEDLLWLCTLTLCRQPGMRVWVHGASSVSTGALGEWEAASTEMLAHLLQGCSHCELLFPSLCQPRASSALAPILPSPGASRAAAHSHSAQWPGWCCWEGLCGAGSGLAQRGSLHTMGMGTAGPGACSGSNSPPKPTPPDKLGLLLHSQTGTLVFIEGISH